MMHKRIRTRRMQITQCLVVCKAGNWESREEEEQKSEKEKGGKREKKKKGSFRLSLQSRTTWSRMHTLRQASDGCSVPFRTQDFVGQRGRGQGKVGGDAVWCEQLDTDFLRAAGPLSNFVIKR